MSRLAIDVVLLPPEDIMDLAVNLNAKLPKHADDEFTLNKTDFLPHVTLRMGLIRPQQLPEIKERLSQIAKDIAPLRLAITSIGSSSPRLDGRTLSALELEKSMELQKLHERVFNEITPLCSYDNVALEMFYHGTKAIPEYWTNGRVQTATLERYRPHITLGFGTLPNITPITFSPSRLALCHLGEHCTCRKVLAEFELI